MPSSKLIPLGQNSCPIRLGVIARGLGLGEVPGAWCHPRPAPARGSGRNLIADIARDGYGIYVAPLKTYRPRFVFLPDEGMAFFLALCRERDPRQPVFVRADGRPWQPRHHRHLFRRAVRSAKLPEAFTFHGLRHTYASQLVQAGTPLSVIAEQLGHASTMTVSRTYGHLAPQIREAEVRQRFTALDAENAVAATRQAETLLDLRARLHGPDWRGYAQIADVGCWPRSNFFRGDAELVRICRGAELTPG